MQDLIYLTRLICSDVLTGKHRLQLGLEVGPAYIVNSARYGLSFLIFRASGAVHLHLLMPSFDYSVLHAQVDNKVSTSENLSHAYIYVSLFYTERHIFTYRKRQTTKQSL